MPRKIASKEDVRTRLAELSGWQTATRNDGAVAKTLQDTRAMDQIYPLSEAAFFDELFHDIREIGAWDLQEALDPKDRAGASYPFIQFVLCPIMRCVGGVQSMLATPGVLATDEALMGVLGFNAAQVQHGSNDRGVSRRTKPVEIRGALSFETVADNLVTIGPARLAELFNGAIRCVAKQGMFPKRIDAVLDATDDEATPTYTTDAADGEVPRVSRAKRPDVRANTHAKKITGTVFGWKVWIVFDPGSKIPLALAIDGINVSDNEHADAVFDGMTIAARAIGAQQGWLYLRGEYRYLLPHLQKVLERRRARGLLAGPPRAHRTAARHTRRAIRAPGLGDPGHGREWIRDLSRLRDIILAIDQGNEICCLPDCLAAPPADVAGWCAGVNAAVLGARYAPLAFDAKDSLIRLSPHVVTSERELEQALALLESEIARCRIGKSRAA